jgi:hypothetical protein
MWHFLWISDSKKKGFAHPPQNRSLPPTFTDFTTFPPSFLFPSNVNKFLLLSPYIARFYSGNTPTEK